MGMRMRQKAVGPPPKRKKMNERRGATEFQKTLGGLSTCVGALDREGGPATRDAQDSCGRRSLIACTVPLYVVERCVGLSPDRAIDQILCALRGFLPDRVRSIEILIPVCSATPEHGTSEAERMSGGPGARRGVQAQRSQSSQHTFI